MPGDAFEVEQAVCAPVTPNSRKHGPTSRADLANGGDHRTHLSDLLKSAPKSFSFRKAFRYIRRIKATQEGG